MNPFLDRRDAGRRLAVAVAELDLSDPVVLGLPRGGVVVAAEVADVLRAPLDVVVVRKLGVPWQPELAMGAVGEGGTVVLNDTVIRRARVSADELEAVRVREAAEVERRAQRFRAGRPRPSLEGRSVVVVDDGLATGATARAALQVVRAQHVRSLVLAVPVAPPEAVRALQQEADQVVALLTPASFGAVGLLYDDFGQTTDDEVVRLLADRA